MYKERAKIYEEMESLLKSKLLVYVTSDRPGCEAQIAGDVIDLFIQHLDKIGNVQKITLYLYTRGGDTAVAWNLVNLLRQYCKRLDVIIPHKAHSAGTLISIGANSIIMTKQATLGPIDPSINTPLNPPIPGDPLGRTMSVSVEAVKGYLEFAREELMIKDDEALSKIMIKLSESVHPLVLGQVYRSRAQIKMLAEKLLINQISDPDKTNRIISFLCSESGSHDYTITNKEAKNVLGLNVKEPDEKLYLLIKRVYDDLNKDLEFNEPFVPMTVLMKNKGEYKVRRALIESIEGGSHCCIAEGKFSLSASIQGMPPMINNQRISDGWIHEYI